MSPPITPDDWPGIQALLDAALEADPAERETLLATLVGPDSARLALLTRLLEQCEQGLPLLDRPAAERFEGLLGDTLVRFPAGLEGRYRSLRELGRGGMAAVYLARDLRHGRDVAVKIMRPELSAALGRDRFLREIEIAASLRHPHIVPLFDSGESDGLLFYVMPYEEGRSLRDRLVQGPVPLGQAIEILSDVCDALAYAHGRGFVHRDIKPDNILLAGRHALVTDFGIARVVTAARDQPTVTGALGTPAYMAPEQAAGGGGDHRVDIYALGVTALEMVSGQREYREGLLRPPLDGIVRRCLASEPDQRFASVEELAAGLRGPGGRSRASRLSRWAGVGLAAALGAALVYTAMPFRPAPARAWPPGIAVLVFQHAEGPGLEALAIGLTDNLIGALGGVAGLDVRSMQAVLPYRDSTTPPEVLGHRLNVSWLVGGRVYRVGLEVVASVELTEATTGRLLERRETRSRPGEGVRLIEELVPTVATMLRERIGEEVQVRSWRAGTRNDAAFAAVGRAHQERRDANRLAALRDLPGAWAGLRRADALLDGAGRADPAWVEPLVQRALVALNAAAMFSGSGYLRDSVPAVLRRGVEYAAGAVEREPGSLRARETLGRLLYEASKTATSSAAATSQQAEAERLLREVSDADTTLVESLTLLGTIYYTRGEYQAAYIMADRAYRADAYSRDPQVVVARLFTYAFEAEEDAEASRWCEEYGERLRTDWFAGYCRLMLMTWDTTRAANPDSALRVAGLAIANAPRVIRPSVALQLRTLAAGVLARTSPSGARRLLAEVDSTAAADPDAAREPFSSDLLELEAGVRLRLGDRERARDLLAELLRRHPDRAARLGQSRRFRGLPIPVPAPESGGTHR